MRLIWGVLWIYGIWKGWQQITSGSDFGAWIPEKARTWMNQKEVVAMAVKIVVTILLGGLFAFFAIIGLFLKLMNHIAHL